MTVQRVAAISPRAITSICCTGWVEIPVLIFPIVDQSSPKTVHTCGSDRSLQSHFPIDDYVIAFRDQGVMFWGLGSAIAIGASITRGYPIAMAP